MSGPAPAGLIVDPIGDRTRGEALASIELTEPVVGLSKLQGQGVRRGIIGKAVELAAAAGDPKPKKSAYVKWIEGIVPGVGSGPVIAAGLAELYAQIRADRALVDGGLQEEDERREATPGAQRPPPSPRGVAPPPPREVVQPPPREDTPPAPVRRPVIDIDARDHDYSDLPARAGRKTT